MAGELIREEDRGIRRDFHEAGIFRDSPESPSSLLFGEYFPLAPRMASRRAP